MTGTEARCWFCGRSPAPALVWLERFPRPACRDCHSTGRGAQRLPPAGGNGTSRGRGVAADERRDALDAVPFCRTGSVAADPLTSPVGDAEPEDGAEPAPAETAATLAAKIQRLAELGAPTVVLDEYRRRLAAVLA